MCKYKIRVWLGKMIQCHYDLIKPKELVMVDIYLKWTTTFIYSTLQSEYEQMHGLQRRSVNTKLNT